MANGQRFRRMALTAAHRCLPFGTIVKVCSTRKDTCVNVEITDRGPYAGKRLIDLSEKAAQVLGIKEAGVSEVTVEVVNN